MVSRVQAQYHEVRLSLRAARLRRLERAALRRCGEAAFGSGMAGGGEAARRLVEEIGAARRRMDELTGRCEASLEADRADLAAVAAWMRPAVMLRGVCTRLVLRHLRVEERRRLGPRYEALGRIVPSTSEVPAVRARLAEASSERGRWVAPFGGSALPAWSATLGAESLGFGRAIVIQLRSHFLPKAPALAGLAVGWWIASTYTDSHLRSALRSVGIGSGGTRVVSASTYEAMRFWLPLLAAALCAYLGERIGARYQESREG
jgi:hypothetical protein